MIYDLDNSYFLWNDIEHAIKLIQEFYNLDFENEALVIMSNYEEKTHSAWFSQNSTDEFNKLIPKIKNLHNNLYRVLESVYKSQENKRKFDWQQLSPKYPLMKKFAEVNNVFKHYNNKSDNEIYFTKLVHVKPEKNVLEVAVNFKKNGMFEECIIYNGFIRLFLTFLIDYKLISITAAAK